VIDELGLRERTIGVAVDIVIQLHLHTEPSLLEQAIAGRV
jgi:hypothetical protein